MKTHDPGFDPDLDRQLYLEVVDSFKGTPLYDEFLLEHEEILKHKWLESEKAGADIGFAGALISWFTRHRDDWISHERWKARKRN
jgi:hypothetical protein